VVGVTTVGAVFLPQNPPERLRDVVRAADDAGLAELWLWEDCFLESGVATTAAALAFSARVRVGVGLLPVPLRNVALTAMEAATLDRLFPGRVRLAVGHGVQSWMGQVGARVESPVTLLREYLAALRALLAGERVTTEGRYVRLDGVALDWPPPAPTAVLAGATGPKSLRLCGEAADGTVLVAGTTPDGVRAAKALVDGGRAEAGRTDPHPLIAYLHCATGPDADARLAAVYARQEYADVADRGLSGSAAQVAAGARRWIDAGADAVVLQPTEDDPDPAGFVAFAASVGRELS
jgi:alkanesulfonate monooxygenase SsuD/methylene tetrahydromethanopterin reductase-like flavin-dependent oxidoreductase (luciferase family)